MIVCAAPRKERPPTVAFVLEQTLGHVTHSANLESLLGASRGFDITFVPVQFETFGLASRLPGYSNWTVRAGLRARRAIRRLWGKRRITAMFIHTQVPAILVRGWMRRIPTIISLDATPVQYDSLGAFYAHDQSSPRIERWKKSANTRCFARARHLVVWADWTKVSLVRDYHVEPARITVIAPGVDVERWQRLANSERSPTPVRVLFVGGDLERKGGLLLLEAARQLRAECSVGEFELHLVTKSQIEQESGVFVHTMTPNSPELVALYHQSHIFCLPTLGDCLPMVLSEAGVTGMALIATDVGAISEIVKDRETGLLIAPGDLAALKAALRELINDGELRARLGGCAERLVRRDFDARINSARIMGLLDELAGDAR